MPKKMKIFILKHGGLAMVIGIWCVLVLIPVIMERNFSPPNFNETTQLDGWVVEVKKYPPHLTIQTRDGKLRSFNFPTVMSSLFDKQMGKLIFSRDIENRFRNMGLVEVHIRIDSVSSILPRVYPRIWEIDSTSFSLSYDHLLGHYKQFKPGELTAFHWVSGLVFLFVGIFIDYLRGIKK